MGTSTSWGQVTAKLNGLAREYADLPKSQVAEGSLIVKKSVSALMPDHLRGVGKKGAKLAVRFVMTDAAGEDASSTIFVTGPAQLIEGDTKAHPIPKLKGARSKKQTKATRLYGPAFGGLKTNGKALTLGGDAVRRNVWHPGTKGKHPWAKGVEAAMPLVRRLFEVKSDLALRRFF